MSKGWRKPKAGWQKPKRRKPKQGQGGSGGGGTMSGIRSAFRATVRGKGGDAGKPGPISRAIDMALWVAIAGALVYFVANAKCT